MFQQLPVKTLVKVLTHLKGGSLGFDPFRDPRTAKKPDLIRFILESYSNDAISAAVAAVTALEAHTSDPAIEATTPPPYSATPEDAKLQALKVLLAGSSVDPAQVKAIVDAAVATAFATHKEAIAAVVDAKIKTLSAPLRIEVLDRQTLEVKQLGVQHKCFPVLLTMAQARKPDGHRHNIWLRGPAGTGKTTAAHKLAEALNLKFYFDGSLATEFELLGFTDANGKTVRTSFREAYEHGGVYLFDEIDGSQQRALLKFNAALANGVCPFPDAMVKRHPDCLILAGANSWGMGDAASDYTGTFKLNAAFRDRFDGLDWPIDEALELAIAGNAAWVKRVQQVRAAVEKRSIKGHVISPRASIHGASLLASGLLQDQVEAAVLRKGLSKEQWELVC